MKVIDHKKARIEFGKKLREIREKRGLTQADAAEMTGINVNYFARIERGEVNFSFEKLINIFINLKVRVMDVLSY